ncbi:non-canonical purine NTP pyrophosphatase [Patescibacteria group bacterium]
MREILIATKNPGKILEIREIFKLLDNSIQLVFLSELGIKGEPVEDESTFKDNAWKKVEFYSDFTNIPILAEDSGLEIDYLNGEPGVLSRRWPGHEMTDEEALEIALTKMEGVSWAKRGAQFTVVMALKIIGQDIMFAEGFIRGILTTEPKAKIIPGYPYRSIFYVPSLGKTLGELTMKEEARVAHRKDALLKLMPFLMNI